MNHAVPDRDSFTEKKSYHVLVIEDDRSHVEMIRRVFSASPDMFHVTCVYTIHEAHPILRDDPPDLIIADLQLPDGRGIDILPRKNGIVSTPLVIMTGRGTEQLAVEMMKTGAIDYVVKSKAMFQDLPRIAHRAIRDWDNIIHRKAAERKAQETSEQFRQLTENIDASISWYDMNGKILYLNSRAALYLGGEPGSFIGKSVHDIFSRQVAYTIVARLGMIHEHSDRSAVYEEMVTLPTGTHWLLSIYSPVKDLKGHVSGVHVIATDITEKKNAEIHRLNAQKQLADILDLLPDATFAIDKGGNVIVWNKAMEELTGIPAREILGKGDRAYSFPFYGEKRPILIDLVLSGDKEIEEKYQNVHWKGEVITSESYSPGCYGGKGAYLWGTASPLYDADGNRTGAIEVIRDITQRKEMERALTDSEIRYRTLVETSPDAIGLIDADGFILFVNNRALSLFGYKSAEELIGKHILSLIIPGETDTAKHAFAELKQRGEHSAVLTATRKNGTTFPGEITGKIIKDAEGKPQYAMLVLHDLTRRLQAEEALRRSESRFRELSDLLPQAVFEADSAGVLTYANRMAFEIFGYSREDLENGLNILDMIVPVDRERVGAIFQGMIRGEIPAQESDKFHAMRRDGSWFPVAIYTALIKSDGGVCGIRGITIDITERRRAEEALRESEAKYHAIVEDQTEFICRFRPDGTHIFVNGAYARYFGRSREELEGKIFKPNIFPGDRAKVRDFFTSLTPSHPGDYIEHRIVMPDGSVRWQRWSDRAIFDEMGILREYQSVGRDITEQKIFEETLRISEEKFRNVLENIPDLVIVHRDGNILYVNPAMVQTMGITSEEALRTPLMEFIAPEYHKVVAQAIRDRMGAREIDPYEIEIISNAGRQRRVIVRGTLIEFAGAPASLNVLTDITERKKTENALSESEKKHRQLFETMAQGVIYQDAEGRIVEANPAAELILGVSVAQMRGKTNNDPSWGAVHADGTDYSGDMHPSTLALQTGREVKDIMGIYNRAEGCTHWILVDSVPQFREGEEKPFQVFTTFEDITELKNVEASLRERESVLETIMNATTHTIALMDHQGVIININESGARRFGSTVNEIMGQCAYDLLPPDVARPRKAAIGRVFETGKPAQIDDMRAGMAIHNEIYPVFDPEHTYVDRVAIFATDVTEKKRMEDALRESEERYREILNNTLDSIYIVDPTDDGRFRVQYSNPASRKNMDIYLPVAEGHYLEEIFSGKTREQIISAYRECASKGTIVRFEEAHAIDQGNRYYFTTLVPLSDSKGKVTRIIGLSHDVTSLKQMESEIRSLNKALEKRVEERTAELRWANEALKEEISQRIDAEKKLRRLLDEKVLLLKEVHHRVKNNLQIIISLLNLQSRYITDKKTLAAIRESQNRIMAMAMVHEKLYRTADLSRIDLGDYIRFLGESLFRFYGARARKITLKTDIPEIFVDINAAIPFGLIMNELVSNSLKYAFPEEKGGEIAVSIRKENHTLTVQCSDNGVGMPAHLDWRNTQSLGLRLVNSLVEQLSGTIELDRSAGTRFSLVLHDKT